MKVSLLQQAGNPFTPPPFTINASATTMLPWQQLFASRRQRVRPITDRSRKRRREDKKRRGREVEWKKERMRKKERNWEGEEGLHQTKKTGREGPLFVCFCLATSMALRPEAESISRFLGAQSGELKPRQQTSTVTIMSTGLWTVAVQEQKLKCSERLILPRQTGFKASDSDFTANSSSFPLLFLPHTNKNRMCLHLKTITGKCSWVSGNEGNH